MNSEIKVTPIAYGYDGTYLNYIPYKVMLATSDGRMERLGLVETRIDANGKIVEQNFGCSLAPNSELWRNELELANWVQIALQCAKAYTSALINKER